MNHAAKRVWWSVGLVSIIAVVGAALVRLSAEPEVATAAEPRNKTERAVVRVAETKREDFVLTARHAGELDADAVALAAQTSGLLQEVAARIGDVVEQGQLLARVDDSQARREQLEARAQARAAEAAHRRVQADLQAVSAELSRTEPLLEDQLVSPQELDTLRARVQALSAEAQAAMAQHEQAEARIALLADQVRRSRLISPFDGAVAERHLDPGAVVQPGTPVLRLVRRGPLRVRFRVPERELARVSVGMPLEVTTQATGGERFAGEVTRLSAEVSRDDRSLAVEGLLSQAHPALRPGMYAQVLLTYGQLEQAVTLPSASVVERMQAGGEVSAGVYVIEQDTAHFRPVRVLGKAQGRSAVEGVEAGAQVVTLGQQGLRDGAPVRLEQDG